LLKSSYPPASRGLSPITRMIRAKASNVAGTALASVVNVSSTSPTCAAWYEAPAARAGSASGQSGTANGSGVTRTR
jgi:hypothetical protein